MIFCARFCGYENFLALIQQYQALKRAAVSATMWLIWAVAYECGLWSERWVGRWLGPDHGPWKRLRAPHRRPQIFFKNFGVQSGPSPTL